MHDLNTFCYEAFALKSNFVILKKFTQLRLSLFRVFREISRCLIGCHTVLKYWSSSLADLQQDSFQHPVWDLQLPVSGRQSHIYSPPQHTGHRARRSENIGFTEKYMISLTSVAGMGLIGYHGLISTVCGNIGRFRFILQM